MNWNDNFRQDTFANIAPYYLLQVIVIVNELSYFSHEPLAINKMFGSGRIFSAPVKVELKKGVVTWVYGQISSIDCQGRSVVFIIIHLHLKNQKKKLINIKNEL